MNEQIIENIQMDDIQNAGLVILHPFLQRLFENLDWCKGTIWKDESCLNKAVLATQYLVTGKQEYDSVDLSVNKMLCGLANDYQIDSAVLLTKEEIEECRNLLISTILYWKALKNTSIEGLQEHFLQRAGILTITNGQTHLWLGKWGGDILLENIPWSVHLFKTPWMSQLLFCHW